MFSSKSEKRKQIAEMAEVSRLKPFEYLEMIGQYAERFGLDPDKVYSGTSFETVTNFLLSWRARSEFDDRYSEAEKLINGNPTQ